MERKIVSSLSVCIGLLFVIAIVYMALGIAIDSRRGMIQAQNTFNSFISEAASISQREQPADEMYRQIQTSALSKTELASVYITDFGKNIMLTENKALANPSLFMSTYSSSVLEFSGRQITITANVLTLTNSDIFSRTRTAFLIILAGTLMAGILLVVVSFRPETGAEDSVADPKEVPPFEDDIKSPLNIQKQLNIEEIDALLSPLQSPHTESPPETSRQPDRQAPFSAPEEFDMPSLSEILSQPDDKAPPLKKEKKSQSSPSAHQLDIENDIPVIFNDFSTASPLDVQISESAAPASAEISVGSHEYSYATVSGFMSEGLLESSLNAFIEKACAENTDLSLLLIKISDLDYFNDEAQELYGLLEMYFGSKEVVFEYGDDCFAGALFNADTDEAMITAEKIIADVSATLNDYGDGRSHQICAGLSSCASRKIQAARLLLEAAEALKRAQESAEAPIIAFRVDPEKYRRYMEETANNKKNILSV